MNLKSPRARLIGILALFLFIFLFSKWGRPERSPTQLDFDAWCESRLSSFSSASGEDSKSALTNLPSLSMEIENANHEPIKNLKIDGISHSDHIPRLTRLLQLMREADIFSVSDRSRFEGQLVTIRVHDSEKDFFAKFSDDDIKGNVKALLLLRLFEEYADRNPSTPLEGGVHFDSKA